MSNGRSAAPHGRTAARARRGLILAVCLGAGAAAPAILQAQVGNPPQDSPFHDVTTAQALTLFYGHFFTQTPQAPVGLQSAPFAGLRLETRLSGPLDLYVTFAEARSSRHQLVPTDTVNRVRGLVTQNLVAADLALILNLTGPKSWHHIAPYAGLGFGIIQDVSGVVDPGGFKVGSNFIAAPTLGTKIFLGRSLALRLEARDYLLRYEWPLAYFAPTDSTGAALPPVLPLTDKTRQVTHNFTLTAGVAYQFNF